MSQGMLLHLRANPRIGTGQILRGLTLARQWIADGGHVVFVSSDVPGVLLRQIARSGCQAVYLNWASDDPKFADRLVQLARKNHCQWIVTDDRCPNLLHNLSSARTSELLLTVIGKPEQVDSVDFSTGNTPDFALVRHNLSPETIRLVGRKSVRPRCLIDLSNLSGETSAMLLKRLVKRFTRTNYIFDIVTPFASSACEQLHSQNAAIRDQICWHQNCDRVFHSLFAFHLAITSDFGTFFELAYCRVPSRLLTDKVNSIELDRLPEDTWTNLPSEQVHDTDFESDNTGSDSSICELWDWTEGMLARPNRLAGHESTIGAIVDKFGATRICRALQQDGRRQSRSA